METPYLPFLEGPRDLDAATFRWRLGVRPLDLHDWIELGPDADAAIARKPILNAQHPATVFVALDDVEREANEVATSLLDHLRRRWPERYADTVLDAALHPLDAVARLVPEDLVLMVERPIASDAGRTQMVLGAASVCFPNRWDLRSKLGRTLAEIHQPVALLNEQLAQPVDKFFERLTPERSFWRLGWGVLDTDDWYTPLDGTASPRPVDPAPERLFLRVERETLRRFSMTNAVLFTIRTYVTPIPVVAADPGVTKRLADALDGLPAAVRGYKDVSTLAPRLIDHLRRCAGSKVDTL